MQPLSPPSSSPVVQAVPSFSLLPKVKLPWHRVASDTSIFNTNPAPPQQPQPMISQTFIPPSQSVTPPVISQQPTPESSSTASASLPQSPVIFPTLAPATRARLRPFSPRASSYPSLEPMGHSDPCTPTTPAATTPTVLTPSSLPLGDSPPFPPPPPCNVTTKEPSPLNFPPTAITPPDPGYSPNVESRGSSSERYLFGSKYGWNDPDLHVVTKTVQSKPGNSSRVATPPVEIISPSAAASSIQTLSRLSSKCSQIAVYATKKKLEDVDKKLAALTEKLEQNKLSPSFLACLAEVSDAVEKQDSNAAMVAYNAMAKKCAFGEVGQFMLPIKLLLLTAQQVQVFNNGATVNNNCDNESDNNNNNNNSNNNAETVETVSAIE